MKSMSFATDVLNKNKKQIIETFNLQTGLDFNDVSVLSEVNLFNRLGETVILELKFKPSAKEKNESSDISIAFLTKKLSSEETTKDYEMKYKQFVNYVEDLNQKWDKIKKKLKNFDSFFPDQLVCVEIETINDDIVLYHTLNRFIKRDKAGIPGNMRYKIMGYALGRFHSQEYTKITLDPYKPYFNYLKEAGMEDKVIESWEKIFNKVKGSSYIIGDCSLDNIQYNALQPGKGQLDSLCFIDPVFLSNRDRNEDLSGILASLGREIVYNSLISKPDGSLRELLTKTFRAIMDASKELFSTYLLLHPDFIKQTEITADFFIGSYFLQYAYQYTGEDQFSTSYRKVLQVLGTQFLTDQPIKESLGN